MATARQEAADPANLRGNAMRRTVVMITVAVLSCTQTADARPVVSLLEARQNGVVIQKFDISCGAAAEATLLHLKFNDNVTERQVALILIDREEYLKNPRIVRAREGFSLLDLKRFAEQRGYIGEGLGQMTLDDLRQVEPAIVPLRLHGYNHFVVFRGIANDRVVLADPAYGNRAMTLDRFMDAWISLPEIGRVAFVVKRAGQP
jgi:predicted double-glycine peptidase